MKKRIFVIHHHFASHEHYDLRLEYRGTLKSWAVPKKPPLRTGIKRLAIQVENHALSYANFEGNIPKGHYVARADCLAPQLTIVIAREVYCDLRCRYITVCPHMTYVHPLRCHGHLPTTPSPFIRP